MTVYLQLYREENIWLMIKEGQKLRIPIIYKQFLERVLSNPNHDLLVGTVV